VAKEALRFMEPQAERAHVAVMLDIKADVVIRADERAVKQMLINLISNAVKFSNPGGVVVIFCDVAADYRILLGLKDTGLGMTPEMQERAVEPFVQRSDALTVEGRGTGLGLPIVKGLIEGHQGRLVIESVIGKGAKIWVEFPPARLIRQSRVAA
jgi:two-component system cell cycle sensor histidine kinase PleC